MKAKSVYGLLTIALSVMFFSHSCSKDDGGSISDADLALAQDEVYMDALYEDVDNLVVDEVVALDDNGYSNAGLKSTEDNICYTVTVNHPDSTTFPKVVTIDFGEGCSTVFNGDTITRSGKIMVTLTDRWFMLNAKHITKFSNFYFNGVKVEGTRTITNLGLNEKLHFRLGIVLEGGKLTFNDTAWMTREADHVRELAWHFNPLNDTIFVTGTASGKNVLGETYNREITEPVVLVRCSEFAWRWVIAGGKVEISNSNRGNMVLDYTGSGCQGNVEISGNGDNYNYNFTYNHRYNKGGN